MSGYPMHLLYRSESDGRLQLDYNAMIQIIDKIKPEDTPIAIISVNGVKRSGKSFLLNFFLRYLNYPFEYYKTNRWFEFTRQRNVKINDGFIWRGGEKPETTGIWIWSEPFYINKPLEYTSGASFSSSDSEKIAILLLDTQGSFDAQTSFQDNNIVFAISSWLSSLFILNIQKDLSDDKLQFLESFAQFSDSLQNTTSDETQQQEEQQRESNLPFQHLLLLIRDWVYPEDYAYGWHKLNSAEATTAENSKEKPAKVTKNYTYDFIHGKEDYHSESLGIRQDIKSKFQEITSFLMPHPGLPLATKIDATIPEVELDFLEYLVIFVTTVFQCAVQPRILHGQIQNSKNILQMVEDWSEILSSSDKIPDTKRLSEAASEAHLKVSVNRTLELCEGNFNTLASKGCTDFDYETEVQIIITNTIQHFEELAAKFKTTKQKEEIEKHKNELLEIVESCKTTYAIINQAKRIENEQSRIITDMNNTLDKLTNDIRILKAKVATELQQLQQAKNLNAEERRRFAEAIQLSQNNLARLIQEKDQQIQQRDQQIAQLNSAIANRQNVVVHHRRKKKRCIIS